MREHQDNDARTIMTDRTLSQNQSQPQAKACEERAKGGEGRKGVR